MGLDPFLLEVLEDPIDHEPLLYIEARSILYNPRRRVAYEVRGSIPVLLPDEARPVDAAEHRQLEQEPGAVMTGSRAAGG
jgi:uncharacterized protein YbaR (Trm112 family)